MTRLLRHRLWWTVGQLAYWSGLGPLLAHRWRSRCPASWTVLAYHRVGSGPPGGGPDLVRPDRFRRHLRYLKANYDVVTVGEALDRLAGSRPPARPLASVTFDDGYRDNLTEALPILAAEGCRATLYPTLEAIEEGAPPWPHRLTADLSRLALGGVPLAAAEGLPEDVNRLVAEGPRLSAGRRKVRVETIVARFKSLPDEERRRAGLTIAAAAGQGVGALPPMLAPDDLRQWRRAGMEVGCHTHRHPILSRQTQADRLADLEASKRGLEIILESPVVHLAYPNGRPGDWDEGAIGDVRAAGFVSAVTTVEGVNAAGCDPFSIRRISVGDDPLPVFATRLLPLLARPRARAHARAQRSRHPGRPGPATAPSTRPLRVAFIGGRGLGAAYSGIERYYEEVAGRLASRGHRVLAYCRPGFAPPGPTYRGIEIHRLPTVRSKHLETLVHTILSTVDVCFRRVDVVQFHALGSSPFSWLPRLAGKRTIVSVRGLDWQRAKWGGLARVYLRFCETTSMFCPDATAVVSKTLQDHFEKRFRRPVRYIPNGVARTESAPPDGIRRWGLGRRDFFLYAGRLSPEKGLHVLIEAHQTMPGVRLVLAGGSSYSEAYMERLRVLGDGRVVFTGFLTGPLLQELYSNALAFVLPSRMEGLSVALLEAMSYGLPVIASDIPENRELVDECGGYLFHLDDVGDLRRAMRQVTEAPEAALDVGERARQRVRAVFDWDRIAAETEDFYRAVVAGSGRDPAADRTGTALEDSHVATRRRGLGP